MCYVCQRNFHSARLWHRVPAWAEGARNISMVPDFGIGCVRGLKVLEPFPRCQTLA